MLKEMDFYRIITKEKGVYAVFNGIRDALFRKLAEMNRIPIRYAELERVLSEDTFLHQSQIEFIKNSFDEGDKFRHYECNSDGLKIHYFVNASKEEKDDRPIASHLQEHFEVPVDKISGISTIVLFEKHPKLLPIRYPKIIKHELTHAAIEFVIRGDVELEQFYFGEENHRFVEFMCDVIPYLANPSKKENGLNKYIDDSISCFGYDAEEEMSEYIKIIDNLDIEVENPINGRELVKESVPEIPHFKSLGAKYIFILTNISGSDRCKLLGIEEDMYGDKDKAYNWMKTISDAISFEECDKDTLESAKQKLEYLYKHMIDC